jgi:hypothetical protein
MTYYRIPHKSFQDERDGAEKIKALTAQGWTVVNMFRPDYNKHQEYLAQVRDIYNWTCDNVGVAVADWVCINNFWLFKDLDKALLFKLTWGGA